MCGIKLLNLNGSASLGKSSLDGLSFFLSNAFLKGLGSALNELLSFLKSETCDLTNCLDNVELLSAEGLEYYVELSLLLSCGSCSASNSNNDSNQVIADTAITANETIDLPPTARRRHSVSVRFHLAPQLRHWSARLYTICSNMDSVTMRFLRVEALSS